MLIINVFMYIMLKNISTFIFNIVSSNVCLLKLFINDIVKNHVININEIKIFIKTNISNVGCRIYNTAVK